MSCEVFNDTCLAGVSAAGGRLAGVQYQLVPTAWEMIYPVHVDPIGKIRRTGDGFHAVCGEEDLGVFDEGDLAAEAIWGRFLEKSSVQHEMASRTHGTHERHRR